MYHEPDVVKRTYMLMHANADHTQTTMVSSYINGGILPCTLRRLHEIAETEAFSEAGIVQPNEAAVHSAHHVQPAKAVHPSSTGLRNGRGAAVNAATTLGGHIRLRAAAEEGCAFLAEASA